MSNKNIIKRITPDYLIEIVYQIDGICFCYEYKYSHFQQGTITKMNTHLTTYEKTYLDTYENVEINLNNKVIKCIE